MIITLKNADFSQSNIGTLSTWRITRSLGSGATYEGPTSVDKGASFSATITIAEGYEIGAAGVTVTMGGAGQTYTINGNVITISITAVTGNVVIKVPTVNLSTGEEEEPDVPDTPDKTLTGDDTVTLSGMLTTGSAFYNPGGLKKDSYAVDTTVLTYYTVEDIPVEPNTTYICEQSRRIWERTSDKQEISTKLLQNEDPPFIFTTSATTAYVSISFITDENKTPSMSVYNG